MSSGVRIYFILVVFKFYTPNTGTSAAHRVSGSHCALLLWFRKLTNFTHTLISCIRAEGARQSAICARRKKKPSHFNDRVVPIETPKQKDKMVDRTPRRLGVSNSPLGREERTDHFRSSCEKTSKSAWKQAHTIIAGKLLALNIRRMIIYSMR